MTDEEKEQFDRVLEIVVYGNDGKPVFTEEALQLLDTLAAGFQRTAKRMQEKHPKPDWVDEISAADAYTYMLAKICEAPMGLLMEIAVVLWVVTIVEKLKKERQ